ncbi:MAG: hypothetical protein KF850_04930 [Labilithrix sp.]|nr:hypothetical protein [Labilithrix sp.]
MKGKLEVTLTASLTRVIPGGKVDLPVTFANKTTEAARAELPIDPLARFETEAYDAKKKRADVPSSSLPPRRRATTCRRPPSRRSRG